MSVPTPDAIAYFISSHGFGHATRACAVMAALHARQPSLRCEIFTLAPGWLFEESLTGPFALHPCHTDVGLAQADALRVDLPATVAALEALAPFPPERVAALAGQVQALGCGAVLCDIAPLGIAVAQAAGLPSVLIENFTWDWIYSGYTANCQNLQPFVEYFGGLFSQATFHVQTEPVCHRSAGGPVDLTVPPVSRARHTGRAAVRARLGVPAADPLVLITMGGMGWQHTNLSGLARLAPAQFILPTDSPAQDVPANVHILPKQSGLYHPDLVGACDAVIGKIGYSTLAEVYRAGVRYGYVPRQGFRESEKLAGFVQREMSGLAIAAERFSDGSWVGAVPALLALPLGCPAPADGAGQIAEWLLGQALAGAASGVRGTQSE